MLLNSPVDLNLLELFAFPLSTMPGRERTFGFPKLNEGWAWWCTPVIPEVEAGESEFNIVT